VDKKDEEFLKRLLATFKVEAQEHIKALSSGLIELEKAAADEQPKIVETVFREAHSLKGAARAVNLSNIETLCQSLESVFAALRKQEIELSSVLFDLLYEAVDALEKLLSAAEGKPDSPGQINLADITGRLGDVAFGKVVTGHKKAAEVKTQPVADVSLPADETEAQPPEPEIPAAVETVRVSTAKLNPILLQAEELFSAKLASQQRIAELDEISGMVAAWDKEQRKAYSRLQKLNTAAEKKGGQNVSAASRTEELTDFLDWNQAQVRRLESKLAAATRAAKHDNHSVGLIVHSLLDNTKTVMMVSFSNLLEAFPRMVRDISRDRGKDIELVIHGGEAEIDRRILEEVKDPLIHLVRNCIEHGIETPTSRQQNNKPARGTITLAIAQQNSHIEILISDDGAGISAAGIKAAAVKLGIISEDEADNLADSEALSLIFASGISTSPIITDISGRGLGLAIVREKVDRVGGAVSFETHPGAGTTFRLVLPMTTATFRCVIVRAAGNLFAIPTANVERVVSLKQEEIKTVENRQTIELNGHAVSLVRFEDALGLTRQKSTGNNEGKPTAIVLHIDDKRIAFLLDEVINEQEVLIKNLGRQLADVPNIAGATILGTGRVVPIFNVRDLIESAVQASAAARPAIVAAEKAEEKKPAVLVVEDSITARTLLKNILQAAGYDTTAAIDGIDAFAQLRSREFDIVISDVDMPRMNGFDLTAKIRTDKKLAELPVILLTALESREHRERGIEVGANAYIVKSSFDQSNLLEVIRRLV